VKGAMSSSPKIATTLHAIALTSIMVTLPLLTSCVQSVYPFYRDSDVIFDQDLAGSWVGVGEVVGDKGCLVDIVADAIREVRHYNVELARAPGGGCSDVPSDLTPISGGAQLLKVGQQRFLDVWDDDYGLHNIFKINADSQTLSLIPVEPDPLEHRMNNKTVNLKGRIEGHTMWPTDILLTSSTEDLHKFIVKHAGDKDLFGAQDAVRLRRK
jgi:hypothetical protein